MAPVFRRIPERFFIVPVFVVLVVATMAVLVCIVLAAKRILNLAGVKNTRPILGA